MLDNEHDMILGGRNKRITIPMADRFIWRQFADALRGLAMTLDHYSRLPATQDMPEIMMHRYVGTEIDRANNLIKYAAAQAGIEIKEGRPKANKPKEQDEHEQKTVEMVESRNIQYLDKRKY